MNNLLSRKFVDEKKGEYVYLRLPIALEDYEITHFELVIYLHTWVNHRIHFLTAGLYTTGTSTFYHDSNTYIAHSTTHSLSNRRRLSKLLSFE